MKMKNTVVLTDLRTREMQDAAVFLAEQGYEVRTVPESVCLWKEAELREWSAEFAGELAGVIHPAPPAFLSPMLETTEEEYAKARNEGPMAAWCTAKVFGGIMRAQGSGSLIFLGSIHAEKPVGRGFLFSSGCGAVQMLSREINQDYGPFGVRSFYIQRGPGEADPDLKSDLSPLYCGLEKRYPLRRLPKRGELNGLLAFLLSPAAAPLAGSDLRADGGMTMYYGERITEEQAEKLRRHTPGAEGGGIIGFK